MLVLVDKRNMESSSDTTNNFNSGAMPAQLHATPSKGLYQACPLVLEIAKFRAISLHFALKLRVS